MKQAFRGASLVALLLAIALGAAALVYRAIRPACCWVSAWASR